MAPKYKIPLMLACLLLSINTRAQPVKYTQTMNAAGGSKDIAGKNYEWSVGEMALVSTGTSSNIIVTQGVLQPAPVPGGVSGTPGLTEYVSVYPVPSKSVVYLQYNMPVSGKLQYELTDITGKSILKSAININTGRSQKAIDLEQYANAGYMLHVDFTAADGSHSASSFKLEKIN